jgi:AraC-like DNA-binding protein
MARLSADAALPAYAELIEGDRLDERSQGDPEHKLVYVRHGRFELAGPRGDWLIPMSHMVFVPAGRPYVARTPPTTLLLVAHLDPEGVPWRHHGCWASPVPPLAREMLLYALRWQPAQSGADPLARAFFRTIGLLCPDWFARDRILWLPAAQSREVEKAMRHVIAHLDAASVDRAAAAAGLSARTLRRRFGAETGMGWRSFVREARMRRAVEMLAEGRARVSEVALAVGFNSMGAFTQAFAAFAGKTPSAFSRERRGERHPSASPARRPRDTLPEPQPSAGHRLTMPVAGLAGRG